MCKALHELVYDSYLMVRYWRENEAVWDVLRYKRLDETWAQFCQRTIEAREKIQRLRIQGLTADLEVVAEHQEREADAGAQWRRLAATLYSQRGLAYLTNLRDFPRALADFERASALHGEHGMPSALNNMAVAYLYLGNLKRDVRYFEMAEEKLREGRQTASSSVSGGNLAVALIKQGRFEEAVRVARTATQRARTERLYNANAFHHLAFALYSLGLHERAVRCIDKALKWKPDYGEAYFTRGLALQELGRIDEATESLEKALAVSRGSDVWTYCHMYANSGEPCTEGFAPRQRPPDGLEEELGEDSGDVSERSSDDEAPAAGWRPNLFRRLRNAAGEEGGDEDDLGEEDWSAEGWEESEDDDDDDDDDADNLGPEPMVVAQPDW